MKEGPNVSLRDSMIVHRAIRGTGIVNGEAIAPVRTVCGRSLGSFVRGVVARGPRLSCRDCAREVYGQRANLADLREHGVYDGPLS